MHARSFHVFLTGTVTLSFCLTSPTNAGTTSPKDLVYFLQRLTNLDWLPNLEVWVTCKQFSSYDRNSRIDDQGNLINWGANGDAGHYMRVEPSGEAVMAQMEGPGCIVQIWSANPQGRIRFYFDGSQTPLELDFAAMTTGVAAPFSPPISSRDGAGCNSYLPMPYAKSCKVTADKPHGQYYHNAYLTFPPSTRVHTFRLPLSNDERNVLDTVLDFWTNRMGNAPFPPSVNLKTVNKDVTIPSGKTVVLSSLAGPAIITAFKSKLRSSERHALRKILVQGFWDDCAKPCIEVPIGDFFGTGFYENRYKSLAMGVTDEGAYCYYPMPFHRRARLQVTNEGTQDATIFLPDLLSLPNLKCPVSGVHSRKTVALTG